MRTPTRHCWECEKPYRVRGKKVGPFKGHEDDQRVYRGCEPFCSLRCALAYARAAYDSSRLNYDEDDLVKYDGKKLAALPAFPEEVAK